VDFDLIRHDCQSLVFLAKRRRLSLGLTDLLSAIRNSSLYETRNLTLPVDLQPKYSAGYLARISGQLTRLEQKAVVS